MSSFFVLRIVNFKLIGFNNQFVRQLDSTDSLGMHFFTSDDLRDVKALLTFKQAVYLKNRLEFLWKKEHLVLKIEPQYKWITVSF